MLSQGDYAEGLRWLVASSERGIVAYVGIPAQSPSASFTEDQLNDGGLGCPRPRGRDWTYSGPGEGPVRAEGWHWFGWMYAHVWDLHPEVYGGPAPTQGMAEADVTEMLPAFAAWLAFTNWARGDGGPDATEDPTA